MNCGWTGEMAGKRVQETGPYQQRRALRPSASQHYWTTSAISTAHPQPQKNYRLLLGRLNPAHSLNLGSQPGPLSTEMGAPY